MRILFYPDKVVDYARIRVIFKLLGWQIIEDTKEKFDNVIYWNTKVINKPDFTIRKLANSYLIDYYPVINLKCNDVSKSHITEVYERVFGNILHINPEKYSGPAVRKKNIAQGDKSGKIINCPAKKEEGYHYQKLLQNVRGGLIREYRAFIVNGIRSLNVKYKKIENRFKTEVEKNEYFEIKDILSDRQISDINRFCNLMGIDYGELDMLWDRGALYIIDANNIPGIGHFEYMNLDVYNKTNKEIAGAMEEMLR